jgi:hypothetical protein
MGDGQTQPAVGARISNPETVVSDVVEARRRTFLRAIGGLIKKAGRALAPVALGSTIGMCVRSIVRVARAEAMASDQVTLLLYDLLACTNHFPSNGIEPRVIVDATINNIPADFAHHGALLEAAASAIISPIKSIIFERSIENMFLAAGHATTWAGVGSKLPMRPSDFKYDELVSACISSRCLLTLYSNVLSRLSSCRSIQEEKKITDDIMLWITLWDFSLPESDVKILLLIPLLLSLTSRQLVQGHLAETQFLGFYSKVSDLAAKAMLDKDTSGFLGFIGLNQCRSSKRNSAASMLSTLQLILLMPID